MNPDPAQLDAPPADADIVQRNFGLRLEQDEWLRDRSHRDRKPKAEIVREAIDEYMQHHE
jgi:predicted DNA-binding protein